MNSPWCLHTGARIARNPTILYGLLKSHTQHAQCVLDGRHPLPAPTISLTQVRTAEVPTSATMTDSHLAATWALQVTTRVSAVVAFRWLQD